MTKGEEEKRIWKTRKMTKRKTKKEEENDKQRIRGNKIKKKRISGQTQWQKK